MTGIEIHLHGKPVTKLEAARAAANLGRGYESPDIRVGEPDEVGDIKRRYITVHSRYHAYGDMQPAEVSWPSIGSVPSEEARVFAESIALGAEIAELADMIAAEQDQAAEPPEHDETASPDRAGTIRRAAELIDTAQPADLKRYLAQTTAYVHLKNDPAALRVIFQEAADMTPPTFGTWKIAQQLLHAAGLPH